MKTDWKVIDIVAACMENSIRINFQPEKRFYRVRLKACCGIFDMRSHCFLKASEEIFTHAFELRYKEVDNSLEALEELLEEFDLFCVPPQIDTGWHTVAGQHCA